MKIRTALISILFFPFLVFAQNATTLPSAGLTPESPFYFFDKFGEALREFFTFNPEGKARLQVTFAAERAAEIKVILETKGVETKGIEVAKARLQTHLANAAIILTEQKSEGKDVSVLAKELDEKLETPKSALAQSFKEQKQTLKAKEKELKAQLKTAHRAGDTAKEEALAQELGKVKAQKELLELKEEDIGDELEAEKEKLGEEMEAQLKAEKAIREAEKEKLEITDELTKEGVDFPANGFAEFDSLLAQAKSALAAGNFAEAKNLAKKAKKSLEQIKKTEEKLKNKLEEKEAAEEAIKEAEEKKQEILSEAGKKGIVLPSAAFAEFEKLLTQVKELFAKENYQEAKRLAKQAKESVKNAHKEMEKLEKGQEQKKEQVKKEKENADKDMEWKKEQAKKEEEIKREQKKQQEEALKQKEAEKQQGEAEEQGNEAKGR